LSGLEIGEICLHNRNQRMFSPHRPKKPGTGPIHQTFAIWNALYPNTASRDWAKILPYLRRVRALRLHALRDIQCEHWVESQLLVLADNQLARKCEVHSMRGLFVGHAPIGIPAGLPVARRGASIPFQLPLPISFAHRRPWGPTGGGRDGYVDILTQTNRRGLYVWEVKDPGQPQHQQDEYPAVDQAYCYARFLQREEASNAIARFAGLGDGGIREVVAVGIVGLGRAPDDERFLRALRQRIIALREYEHQRGGHAMRIGLAAYDSHSFQKDRLIRGLHWVEMPA
jgi:hypothetical protein